MRAAGPKHEPRLDPKHANRLYHDAIAPFYDAKWAISFDERCTAYVRDRALRMLPRRRYGRVLEIGCGTGFLILNLWQTGYVAEAHACDLSPGMLAACARSARMVGCDIRLRAGDAERLPYRDGSFDLVVGHAVLHHLPRPQAALEEAWRVLSPGGAAWIAGEPTAAGDRLARGSASAARAVVRAAARVMPKLRKPPDPPPASEEERILRELEAEVDLNVFEPSELKALWREAGFQDVRVETEELLSSLVGWAVRVLEAEAPPGLLGRRWASLAYRTYRRLYAVDRSLLYPVLPRRWFYNALVYGRKPAEAP